MTAAEVYEVCMAGAQAQLKAATEAHGHTRDELIARAGVCAQMATAAAILHAGQYPVRQPDIEPSEL